jgi:superfamily II DNA/RNA helicase
LVEVARPNATASTVEQRFYSVADEDKRRLITQLLRQREIRQAIVFVNSKLGAARLARTFERDGLRTAALHGDKSQDERLKSLAAFKAGEVDLLVATDVAARGLDIADLPAVFNYDVPFNAEDYVHRIGRTGRAGASGIAITLVTRDDTRLVGDIEKLIKKKIDLEAAELEDDRPRRRRREFEEFPQETAEPPTRAPASVAPAYPPARTVRSHRAPQDPFFDRPYEPDPNATPVWEDTQATPASATTASRSHPVSRFIKPKRRIATLLGGKVPT